MHTKPVTKSNGKIKYGITICYFYVEVSLILVSKRGLAMNGELLFVVVCCCRRRRGPKINQTRIQRAGLGANPTQGRVATRWVGLHGVGLGP
jgi:hypothetical protein